MSRKQIILITGANGEIGKNLIDYLAKNGPNNIVTLDLEKILSAFCLKDIIDKCL